jgi:hypothetical protein
LFLCLSIALLANCDFVALPGPTGTNICLKNLGGFELEPSTELQKAALFAHRTASPFMAKQEDRIERPDLGLIAARPMDSNLEDTTAFAAMPTAFQMPH